MPDPPVTVVIVHWDQAERCVRTGRAFAAQRGVDARLIVVDNGSARAAVALTRILPSARCSHSGQNHSKGTGRRTGES